MVVLDGEVKTVDVFDEHDFASLFVLFLFLVPKVGVIILYGVHKPAS